MKKLYFTLLALLISTVAFSQVIVDEGFETGNTVGQSPVGWICSDNGWKAGITIPDDACGLNYCVISILDSSYHVSFRLDRKKFDGFVRTIPERYGVRKSEKRDLPPPVSKRGNDVSWWDPPADAECYSGSGQINIVYDPGKETVYLYCFTI